MKKHKSTQLPSVKLSSESKHRLMVIMIVLIVGGSTITSYMIRTQDLNYSLELDEFDPYFNYRATKYLYENGYDAYLNWDDTLSWYPVGRDVSATSQNALHIIAAYTYVPFSSTVDLYTYTIYFPAIVGSLTTIVMFMLVRVMAGNYAATIAATFFAISVPFIQRGTGGWFKSEPLGLFLGFLGLYFFISMMNRTTCVKKNYFDIITRSVVAGALIAIGVSAWGGVIFFMIPIAIWLITIPLKTKITKAMCIGMIVFTVTLLAQSTMFDRAEIMLFGLASVCVIGPILFILIYTYIPIKSSKYRYVISLGIIAAIFAIAVFSGVINLPYGRYLGALIPFTVSAEDALTQSVSEHQIPTFGHIFERTVFTLMFAPVGVFALIKNRVKLENNMHILIIILSAVGIYIGSTYVRLELFMSFGLVLLSSVGIMYILKKISVTKNPTVTYVLVAILLIGMMVPAVINWSIMMDRPTLIMFGASAQSRVSNDWLDALNWIKTETPKDAKIMAWWDYGYWIETKGERTTYMDNAAFHSSSIVDYANILTDEPNVAVTRLKALDVDYVLVYFLGNKITVDGMQNTLAVLDGGGDESKMPWILKIAGRNTTPYVDEHGYLNSKFYAETFYGTLIPFTPYVDAIPGQVIIDTTLRPWEEMINTNTNEPYGYGLVYYNPDKLPDGVTLVYASPEFKDPPSDSLFNAILIYEITD